MEMSMARTRPGSPRLVSSSILALVLAMLPLGASGADDQSVAELRRMGKAFASIAQKASPAVVGIRTSRPVRADSRWRDYFYDEGSPSGEDYFDYFRRRGPRRHEPAEPKELAQGSGFLVTADGFILTSNHLVGEAQDISVQLGDGRKFNGKLVGADPETDVAVVRITAQDLPCVQLADSDTLEVGEWVVAIGNPFGLSHTVTAGIVSAKGRNQMGVADYEDFIQTDAAINLGNSGGPLLNLDGKAVGINTAIIGSEGNIGIGLAIPINMARGVYEQLKANGKVIRGYLGIEIDDLEAGMGEFFGAADATGAIVMRVLTDAAAGQAGVRTDDIIVEMEGEPVTGANALMNRIAMRKPGSKVDLVLLRDGKRRTVTITLGTRPEEDPAEAAVDTASPHDALGLSVTTLTRELGLRLGYEGLTGVLVDDVESGSLADEYGLESEMVIIEVNREAVRNAKQYHQALTRARQKGKVLLRVRIDDWTKLVLIPLPPK